MNGSVASSSEYFDTSLVDGLGYASGLGWLRLYSFTESCLISYWCRGNISMKYQILCATILVAVVVPAHAATTTYGSSATFLAALTSSVTDEYGEDSGYSGVFQTLSDADMSAVFGQTEYTSTGFSNNNILFSGAYSAGAAGSGSFILGFLTTSFSNANGVSGVGFDVLFNDNGLLPYDALVTFGDNSQAIYGLGTGGGVGGYFGITSTNRIKAINFGPGGGISQTGAFAIDNLSVGGVPEPASWAMLIAGFGFVDAAARRRRTAVVV